MNETWIVVTKPGEASALLDAVEGARGNACALVLGPRELAEEAAFGTAVVKWIDAGDAPAESLACSAAEVLAQATPRIAVGYGTPGARAALGIAAQRLGAVAMGNVVFARLDGDTVEADHLIIDNKVVETARMPAPAFLVVDTMAFQPVEPDTAAPQAAVEQVTVSPADFCEVVEVEPIPASGVESADIVVGVGRGVNTPEKFALAKQLADALGAEMSGSMPGVKDFGFFSEGTDYIGLTGVNLNARLYIALGLSGSTPHLAGLLNAGTVVCVNTDPAAQLFDHSDYGIVADVQEAIPELIRALA